MSSYNNMCVGLVQLGIKAATPSFGLQEREDLYIYIYMYVPILDLVDQYTASI